MTRKQAIEKAAKCECVDRCHSQCNGFSHPMVAATRAYDLGRVAGLREAVRVLMEESKPIAKKARRK